MFSIESVSDFSIVTKTSEAKFGLSYKKGQVEKVAANKGTSVFVERLFFNTPARLKFLKSNDYEARLVEDVVESYAVCYENIKFKLQKNDKTITYTNPIKTAFDYNFSEALKIQETINAVTIHGFLLSGLISNKNMIFVNNRLIKEKKIVAIVNRSFSEISGKSGIPFILFISCPFTEVDVNIHPAKTEVRFANKEVYNYIFQAIRNAFLNNKLTSSFAKPPQEDSSNDDFFAFSQLQDSSKISLGVESEPELKENLSPLLHDEPELKENLPPFLHDEHLLKEEIGAYDELDPIGQICYRYILCEQNDALVIIDQHAAHERIVAEKLKKNGFSLQRLISPILININIEEKHLDKLKNIIEFEQSGSTLIITAIPSILYGDYLAKFLENLSHLDEFTNEKTFLYDFLHLFGCKNSIKSGKKLCIEEMKQLIDQLKTTPNNMFCNHGRRIFIRIERHRLDKIFGRLNFSDIF